MFLLTLLDIDLLIMLHALKLEPLELVGTMVDEYGILLHLMQKLFCLSKLKAFLFAASDRHAYA
jgi:hypothetical protein